MFHMLNVQISLQFIKGSNFNWTTTIQGLTHHRQNNTSKWWNRECSNLTVLPVFFIHHSQKIYHLTTSYWHIFKENYEAKATMESTNHQWYTGTHLYNQKIKINKNKLAKWGRISSCDSMRTLHDNETIDFRIPLDVHARDITHFFPHRDGTLLPSLQKFQPGLTLAAELITST